MQFSIYKSCRKHHLFWSWGACGGTGKFDHIAPTLRNLRWLSVKQNLFFRDAVMAFKCMSGQAPRYPSDQFTTKIAVTGRMTRSCQLLNNPLFKSSVRQRTFYYRMVHIWNNLDNTLKTAKSISAFKLFLTKQIDHWLCKYHVMIVCNYI